MKSQWVSNGERFDLYYICIRVRGGEKNYIGVRSYIVHGHGVYYKL